MPNGLDVPGAGFAMSSHAARRKRKLQARSEFRRPTVRRVATPADIPEGSTLADSTIAAFDAGDYTVMARVSDLLPPTQTAPRLTYARKLKQRQKANKLNRLVLVESEV